MNDIGIIVDDSMRQNATKLLTCKLTRTCSINVGICMHVQGPCMYGYMGLNTITLMYFLISVL